MPHPIRTASFCKFSFPRSAWERAFRRSASRIVCVAFVLLIGAAASTEAQQDAPRSLDPRIKIELFAEHPQIVTPTGIDVDHKGRVWAIESNTHFPPEGYKGHPTDRVLVMSETNGDGRADKIVVFADGLKHTMSVALRPLWFPIDPASRGRKPPDGSKPTEAVNDKADRKDSKAANEGPRDARTHPGANAPGSPRSSVYIATRREISLFHDDDGDDKADRHEPIVCVETTGDYPHNGLAGLAFDALGWLYFGFGENLGADYKLIGSDGTTLAGGGEGGCVCRCRLDGSKLERWATGFWNPHASCFDAFGRMFTVDNDPDSRPPCRLLHIIQGGDYGYRFRNGRAGLHPFTSWNGEIPGTLPMVAGTGEAPSGILSYESDGIPEEYIGNLFVTSWGDHRIDRFRLKPRGASFGSVAEPVIVGGEDFRPVGIACAPDGSLYCTDWVKRDYNLHGHGRVWKLSANKQESQIVVDVATVSPPRPVAELKKLLNSRRIATRRASAAALRTTEGGRRQLLLALDDRAQPPRVRIEALRSIAQIPITGDSIADETPGLWSNILLPDEVGPAAYRLIGSPQFPVESYKDWQHARNRDETSPRQHRPVASREAAAATLLAALPLAKNFKLGGLSLFAALQERDPFLFAGVVNELVDGVGNTENILSGYASGAAPDPDSAPHLTLAAFLAARRISNVDIPEGKLGDAIKTALNDGDESLRLSAIRWVAELRLNAFRQQVEGILSDPRISSDLFLATLAALEMLDGVDPKEFDKTPPGKYVLPIVRDEKRTPTVRALALRMVDPTDPTLDAGLLAALLKSPDPALRLEAVRTLQSSPVEQAADLLQSIAADEKQDKALRAEAIVGLARGNNRGELPAETRKLLLSFLKGDDAVLRTEALRSLRGFVATERGVKEAVGNLAQTAGRAGGPLGEEIALALGKASGDSRPRLAGQDLAAGDPAAGRRVFFHTKSAGCYKCHTINGRGGRVGPDLSTIGRSHSREKLVESIFEPGKEIAPQYVTWAFETAEGKVLTGMIVHENEGKTVIGDAEGKLTELKTIDIVSRVAQQKSVMPDKLPEQMTTQEFRDLIAFLESLK
jgi:putative membrane-bound dehydrogenase-like protein